jgi:hypothetical protein
MKEHFKRKHCADEIYLFIRLRVMIKIHFRVVSYDTENVSRRTNSSELLYPGL